MEGGSAPRPSEVCALKYYSGQEAWRVCARIKEMRMMTYFEEQRIEGRSRCPAMTMVKSKEGKKSGREAELDSAFPGSRIPNR